MKAQGVKPDIFTWNSLINGFCENAKIDGAMKVMKEMENNGVVPNIASYNIIIDGLCEAGRLEQAVDVFSVLADKGLQPDVRFLDGKDIKRALEYASMMRSKDFMADNHTFYSLVDLLSNPSVSDADNHIGIAFQSNCFLLTSIDESDPLRFYLGALIIYLSDVYDSSWIAVPLAVTVLAINSWIGSKNGSNIVGFATLFTFLSAISL
ncbi:hypothetical protein RDABS01_029405 [Bienertia sinuspersici]